MLFLSAADFFEQAAKLPHLTREDEKRLAQQFLEDPNTREQLIRSYYPMVAGKIRRMPQQLQTLKTVYACLDTLEKGVDRFNFSQSQELFSHHLSWRLRQCCTRCIAEQSWHEQ